MADPSPVAPSANETSFVGKFPSARELLADLEAGRRSVREVVGEHLDRIDAVNPTINAVIARRSADDVLADADRADGVLAAARAAGTTEQLFADQPLFGLPMAIKDLADVAGIATRAGSTVTSDTPVTVDALFVERLRAAGVIIIGKTNTPEFGVGSNTFNDVFGSTLNPHDPTKTAGGSSGGAAAALASGMLPIADGSDLGGSLRNPAAFCGVVGLRPSLGRVAHVSSHASFLIDLPTEGPMARCAADVGLLLSVMSGPDPRDPRARLDDPAHLAAPLHGDLAGMKVAWGGDLGLPGDEAIVFEREVMAVAKAATESMGDLGAEVHEERPDLTGAMDCFRAFRALGFRRVATEYASWFNTKPTLVENVQFGLQLTVDDVLAAEVTRTRLHREVVNFFDRFDILALPTTQVAPFPFEVEYPTEIEGVAMSDYLEWMTSCCVITATGCPAISVPAGMSADGLPLGLQLVAAPGNERILLEAAHGLGW